MYLYSFLSIWKVFQFFIRSRKNRELFEITHFNFNIIRATDGPKIKKQKPAVCTSGQDCSSPAAVQKKKECFRVLGGLVQLKKSIRNCIFLGRSQIVTVVLLNRVEVYCKATPDSGCHLPQSACCCTLDTVPHLKLFQLKSCNLCK
jgi:hypothetical protein